MSGKKIFTDQTTDLTVSFDKAVIQDIMKVMIAGTLDGADMLTQVRMPSGQWVTVVDLSWQSNDPVPLPDNGSDGSQYYFAAEAHIQFVLQNAGPGTNITVWAGCGNG